VIPQLVKESGVTALYFNRDYTPYAYSRDAALIAALTIESQSSDDAAILPPGKIYY
jgi:deoxyribodipyrimidine photolyase